MKTNVGATDRIIRIVLALVLFSLFFLLEGNLKYLSLIGIIPLLTAFVRFCPLYSLVGTSTCKVK
ncbi:YgaP family membrane protein [Bacillus sp. 2205SS5-2]|uniref:YgaP family membrane protein n=1 Tax=Bacillus sp. 2205SS5-2 TaxID=3109031 RepID=UPI003005A183